MDFLGWLVTLWSTPEPPSQPSRRREPRGVAPNRGIYAAQRKSADPKPDRHVTSRPVVTPQASRGMEPPTSNPIASTKDFRASKSKSKSRRAFWRRSKSPRPEHVIDLSQSHDEQEVPIRRPCCVENQNQIRHQLALIERQNETISRMEQEMNQLRNRNSFLQQQEQSYRRMVRTLLEESKEDQVQQAVEHRSSLLRHRQQTLAIMDDELEWPPQISKQARDRLAPPQLTQKPKHKTGNAVDLTVARMYVEAPRYVTESPISKPRGRSDPPESPTKTSNHRFLRTSSVDTAATTSSSRSPKNNVTTSLPSTAYSTPPRRLNTAPQHSAVSPLSTSSPQRVRNHFVQMRDETVRYSGPTTTLPDDPHTLIPHGVGVARFESGELYAGEFHMGMMHGLGALYPAKEDGVVDAPPSQRGRFDRNRLVQ